LRACTNRYQQQQYQSCFLHVTSESASRLDFPGSWLSTHKDRGLHSESNKGLEEGQGYEGVIAGRSKSLFPDFPHNPLLHLELGACNIAPTGTWP